MVKKLAALDVNKCIGCMECMFARSRRVGRGGFDKSAIRVRSAGLFSGITSGTSLSCANTVASAKNIACIMPLAKIKSLFKREGSDN